jgi:hypothetical protein
VFLDDGRVILADWGDSSICNPLTTLTVFQSSAAYRRGLEIDSPEITRLRDVYLRAWGEYAPREQIQKAVPAARHIGALHRALSWRRAMQSAPPHTTREWADAVPGWLDEFLSGFAGYPGPRIP